MTFLKDISYTLNLFNLFKKGYDLFYLEEKFATEILQYVSKESYESKADRLEYGALWESPNFFNFDSVPDYYQNIVKLLIESNILSSYTNNYGKFDFVKVMLHRTDTGYNNYWHGHWLDGTHLHVLLHFSDPLIRESNLHGGRIEFGYLLDPKELGLNQNYNKLDITKVRVTGSYPSNNGECQILLNTNPLLVHQVTDVLANNSRYTLMISLGYNSNITNEKINKLSHI